jgi:hypothetical protein
VIFIGALAVPATYALARAGGLGEERARIAALLLAFSPASMIYGAASADALFATLGTVAAALLVASGTGRRAAGAIALALASFFSWALLALGVWASVLILVREGIGRAVRVALACAAAVLAFYAILFALSGYDPLGTLSAASDAYDLGISNARPYGFWVVASPVAFMVAAGLPIAWYAARALGAGTPLAIALAAVLAAAAVLGFSKAETERIWLFMAPLAAAAAAAVLPRERLPLVLGLLVAQALASELLLDTIW